VGRVRSHARQRHSYVVPCNVPAAPWDEACCDAQSSSVNTPQTTVSTDISTIQGASEKKGSAMKTATSQRSD